MVGFPFLDGGVPRRPFCGVYVSKPIRFARVCGHVGGFDARDKCLTAELLRRGYRCGKLGGAFFGFCRRRCGLVSGWGRFCIRACRSGVFVVAWCAGLGRLGV